MSRLTIIASLILSAHVAAEDHPALADLKKAKQVHAKELARLREKLLADIDVVIKTESDRGAGINYLQKERKGFEDNGIVPILPKLLPASREYVEEKKNADATLEKAYDGAVAALTKSGWVDEAKTLKKELTDLQGGKKSEPIPEISARKVETKEDLKKYLSETVWEWWTDGDLHLKKDGYVAHAGWEKRGLTTRWVAIDRRTVVLEIERGEKQNVHCILMFAEDLTEYSNFGFGFKMAEMEGRPDKGKPKKRKR